MSFLFLSQASTQRKLTIFKNIYIFFFLGKFITFDTITLVPFEPKLIDFSLMSPDQITWLNDYNAKIVNTVLPFFEGNQMVSQWITERTGYVDPMVGLDKEKEV